MQRIEIADATAEQLRQFGSIILGLQLGGTENRQTMIAKFSEAGYGPDFINLGDPATAPVGSPKEGGAFNSRLNERGDTEVRIVIHKQDKAGGEEPVPVAVNGRSMWMPRGVPHLVPETYVEVLDHAIEKIYPEYDPSENGGRGGLGEPRLVHAYPFSYA